MTYETPGIVISGVPYVVTEVGGHAPTSPEDFTGSVTFLAEHNNGASYEVSGAGAVAEDGSVRFHEKVAHGAGKDVRVWRITGSADGFSAVPG